MKADLLNGGVLLATMCVAASLALAGAGAFEARDSNAVRRRVPDAGARELLDARGSRLQAGAYRRVASLSTVADGMLLELLEPARLIAVTKYSAEIHPDGWKLGSRPRIASSRDVEQVLELAPDLVIVSPFAEESYLARLRERGIQVFDVGATRGVESAREQILKLGELLDCEARAQHLIGRLDRELAALRARGRAAGHVDGLYLSIVGDSLFGGSAGTSYADLLALGGVRDLAAAAGYSGWPAYSLEQLLELDPPLIVTQGGMAQRLRDHSVLGGLQACSSADGILELDGSLSGDGGLALPRAAAELADALEHRRSPDGRPRIRSGD